MVTAHHLDIGGLKVGNDLPLTLIAGPCAMESRQHALDMAGALTEVTKALGIGLIYKTSFDKANRTSISSGRGVGLEDALPVFQEVRSTFGCPVLTDVHERDQCAALKGAVDVLQIPAFLCRQTDLLVAAAQTGLVVNVKKGQFLAPVGHEERRRQGCRVRQPEHHDYRTRRPALATTRWSRTCAACRCYARPVSRRFRCHPLGSATGRAGRHHRRPTRTRTRSWPALPSPWVSLPCSWKPIKTPTTPRRTAPTWCRSPT